VSSAQQFSKLSVHATNMINTKIAKGVSISKVSPQVSLDAADGRSAGVAISTRKASSVTRHHQWHLCGSGACGCRRPIESQYDGSRPEG
jgi:hypothetical protein